MEPAKCPNAVCCKPTSFPAIIALIDKGIPSTSSTEEEMHRVWLKCVLLGPQSGVYTCQPENVWKAEFVGLQRESVAG